ncbi:MAG TPA: Mrp/NBP35 family ATP-binding protein [Longimicrobiales bacterium]|nr:Mrp/NBP35 family ATP-binding protein [Longimicrobiales bacterium]
MAVDREDILRRVRDALAQVKHPRSGADLFAGGQVGEITVDEEGKVRFPFTLRPEDPGTLVKDARAAAEAVPGVTKVKIDVKLPQEAQAGRQGHGHGGHRLQPGAVPAPTPEPSLVKGIEHVFAVSSGKGGVGKSTVAANIAAALAAAGKRVGLLDADVYGPDIPLMFGERRKPKVSGARGAEKIVPLEAHGVKLMSLGFLLEEDQPAIMRGPLVSGILRQFLEQVEWGELDYLVVDMPPGTGDAQLSLVQTIELDGAVMVTTPQDVSTGDVRRAIRMFERVRTPILGLVENMAGLSCPHCGGHVDVFGEGGGGRLAAEMNVALLGSVPLDPRVRQAGDAGSPTTLSAPDSPAGQAFREVTERVVQAVEGALAARA